MIFRWLRAHASAAISAASILVVAALVTVVALVSSGYEEKKLELDDASVWVTNGSRQVVGRANTDVFELNTVVQSEGSDIDVLQRGGTVLTQDHTSNTIQLIDASSSVVVSTVALPAGDPEVTIVSGFVVIHSGDTGEVWVVREANLDTFDDSVEPTLRLGEASVVAVSDDGQLAGYDRAAGLLVTVDVSSGAAPTSRPIEGFEPGDSDKLQITITGGVAVLLDVTTRTLVAAGRTLSLAEDVSGSEEIRLAAPTVAAAPILIAHTNGLVEVDPASGVVTEVVANIAGVPAQPLGDAGCFYAAWSDGSTWQRCGSQPGVRGQVAGIAVDGELAFRSNGRYVVLNERTGGRVWAVQHENRVIDNWDQLIERSDDQQQNTETVTDTPPVLEKDQLPPVAVADDLGARPGRSQALPVLLNDYDPNGDVLSITSVTQPDPGQGTVDIIDTSQRLQLSTTSEASGTLSFEYTISDGRGGTASSSVTVTIRASGDNSPPVQARVGSAVVAVGGSFTSHVLGDWYDPDGDPMYLEQAQTIEPDRVSFSPEGTVDFEDKGAAPASKVIALAVSDFEASGAGTLQITVSEPGAVPLLTEGFLVRGYTAQDVQIEPLPNVRGGTGAVRLSNVTDYPDAVIVPNYGNGTFTFTSQRAGVFYLSYSVTDVTQQTATGTVRIDIEVAPDASTRPITVPTVAFLYQQQTELVDVLASDIDPAGGVLSISGLAEVPPASGAVIEVLEHRVLRVRLNNLLTGPLQFTYTATNGFSSAEGLVTVYQVPEPARLQAPVAVSDKVSVRVGEVVDIPVLTNDSHPNRKPLVLDPELVSTVPPDGGLLFASGSALRYLAPDSPGDFTAIYRVGTTADVQFDTAEVTITVREADVSTNAPPVPPVLSARVLAGEAVTIPVPVDRMDPEGDSTRLVGASSNPAQGNVTVDGDALTYTAGAAAQGTDSFSYEVVDGLGARATGTVRVGITQGLETASAPVAMDDVLVTRPGKSLTVRVLDNDSDPNAGTLRIVSLESADPLVKVKKTSDRITVLAPENPGDYAVLYTIQNDGGQQASAWLRMRVDDKAPPVRPEAADTVLRLGEILDRESVTVDVRKNVFYAEGDSTDLEVSLVPGFESQATVLVDGRIRLRVLQKSQIIPFQVSTSDDAAVSARAFIRVPGLEDARPELRSSAPPLQVRSGDTLNIAINDYVVAAGSRGVQLTDQATVKASNADGALLVVDGRALQFRSADGYWGPASISFEVTDAQSATDPGGRRAVIVLAITVLPRENQPPVFSGAKVSLQPGDQRILELNALTRYPYPDDVDQLVYAINSEPGAGFTATLDGTRITLTAAANATAGASSEFQVGVRDAVNAGKPGVIRLGVVTSNRPLTSPGADTLTIKRGQTASIPVLENDSATNPFPGNPLTVIAVQGAVPPGVSVTPSKDKSTLAVTIAQGVDIKTVGQVSLQYQIADATNDPGRYTWGTVTITIVDVPDVPLAPVLGGSGFVDGQLIVASTPLPYPNGSPITSFLIRSDDNGGYSKDCGASATCVLTNLPAGVNFSFYSVAVNEYGESVPSPKSAPLRSDYLPASPQNVRVTREVADASQGNEGVVIVSWNPIVDPVPGSAVRGIRVQIGGTIISLPKSATSTRYTGIPGAEYTAVVWAENDADTLYPGQLPWNRSTSAAITAAGKPVASSVSAKVVGDAGMVTVEWAAFPANGGADVRYSTERYAAGDENLVCATGSVPGAASSTGKSFASADADRGRTFVYVVYSDNGWGCTAVASQPVRIILPPQPPTVELGYYFIGGGVYGAEVTSIVQPNPLPGASYSYLLRDGSNAVDAKLGSSAKADVQGCVSDLGTTRCSSFVPVSLPPVNANVRIATCQVGQDIASLVTVPGGPGIAWSYLFAFEGANGWSPFGTASVVPLGTTRVAVKSSGADGAFTNGTSPEALVTDSGKTCG